MIAKKPTAALDADWAHGGSPDMFVGIVYRTNRIGGAAVARYAEPMARLIDELKKLPGVGTKTAQRFAFHILRSGDDDASALADAVRGLKASLRLCSICNNITDVDPCAYCTSPTRNQRLVCVVEEPTNIDAVERSRYSGVYHVLHGTLSPLHGVGPDQLRGRSLIQRVERGEWVMDGSNPARPAPPWRARLPPSWLAGTFCGHSTYSRITRIATGVPASGDGIEYADEVTLMARALEGPPRNEALTRRTFCIDRDLAAAGGSNQILGMHRLGQNFRIRSLERACALPVWVSRGCLTREQSKYLASLWQRSARIWMAASMPFQVSHDYVGNEHVQAQSWLHSRSAASPGIHGPRLKASSGSES